MLVNLRRYNPAEVLYVNLLYNISHIASRSGGSFVNALSARRRSLCRHLYFYEMPVKVLTFYEKSSIINFVKKQGSLFWWAERKSSNFDPFT